VELDEGASDGEAKSRSLNGAGRPVTSAEEPGEQALLVLLGQADPGIDDVDANRIQLDRDGDGN